MDEQSRGRRLGPAMITALVVLGLVAGGGAYLLVRHMLVEDIVVDGPGVVGPSGPTAGGPVSATAPGGGSAASPGRTTPGAPIGTQPVGQAVSADACPAATVNAVKIAGRPGGLKRVLYVEASMDGAAGAEAWICQDTDGSLYYQGHNRQEPLTASESRVTILLGPGVKGSVAAAGQGYRAVNPASDGETQYIVNREVLTVITPSGARTEYMVTKYAP